MTTLYFGLPILYLE